jgi:hypothetical protein
MLCLIDKSIQKKIRSDWKSTCHGFPSILIIIIFFLFFLFFFIFFYFCNNYDGYEIPDPLCVVLNNCSCLLAYATIFVNLHSVMSSSSFGKRPLSNVEMNLSKWTLQQHSCVYLTHTVNQLPSVYHPSVITRLWMKPQLSYYLVSPSVTNSVRNRSHIYR